MRDTTPSLSLHFKWGSVFLILLSVHNLGLAQNFNSPPILIPEPRTWNIHIDEPIGSKVATIEVKDHDDDEIEFGLEPGRPIPGLSQKDGSEYFVVVKSGGAGIVKLNKSLSDLKVGDTLSVSVVGNDGSITSRIDIHVTIKDPIHGGEPPVIPSSTSTNAPPTSETTTTTVEAQPITNPTSMPTNAPAKQEENIQNSTPANSNDDEDDGYHMYVITLVPIFIIGPALAVGVYLMRHKIRHCRTYLCCGTSKNPDKDDMRIEEANGEFSHEMHFNLESENPRSRKISMNSSHVYSSDPTATPSGLNGVDPNDPILEDLKWEFPRHQLKIVSMLGEGCFGQVWKYEAEDIVNVKGTTTVAVKTLRSSATEKEKRDLLHELAMMKMLDPHPNVVSLLGCCTEKDPIFIIIEYVNGGTLQEYLRKSRSEHNYRNLHGESQSLTARDLTSFAFQIAKGMAYLSSKKIIHRDLAARNILFSHEDQVCKIADFGFARDIMGNNVYERKSEGRLPIRWMAPESLYDNCYTTKSDVWSFGVLMWEIVALGATPYPGKSASEVMKFVREGGRLEKPPHCDRQLFNVVKNCWGAEADDRPSFEDLVEDFENLLVTDTDYIDLNMFPEHAYYNEISLSDEKV